MLWLYMLGVVLFMVLWIYCGVLITSSNVSCGKLRGQYKGDESINSAYNWSVSAAVVTWVLVGLAVIGIILLIISLFFGGFEVLTGMVAFEPGLYKALTIGSFVVFLILLLTTGICAMMTAIDLQKSPNFSTSNKDFKSAYDNAIIAACVSIGTIGLLVTAYILHSIFKKMRLKNAQKKYQAAEAAAVQSYDQSYDYYASTPPTSG